MSGTHMGTCGSVAFKEDDILEAKIHLGQIKGIIDLLMIVDQEKRTDELFDGTILNLMNCIVSEISRIEKYLEY